MRTAVAIIAFAARHFLAVCLAIVIGCVIWTVGYFLLLVFAICFNEGLGSPLTYPAGLLGIGLVCSVIGWGIFTPAAGLGRIFCRLTQWPLLTAIPVVFTSALLLSYCFYQIFIAAVTTSTMPSVWLVLKNFTLFLSVPLGAYWWLTEGTSALYDAFLRWMAIRKDNQQAHSIALK
ncbi:MAG: hypothetical protein NWT08_13785 [Akkermansiaceae bacterium]|jgi:hypothetical protein|nr:hypothetical protein [Akkermansiaceae bacterium]MDP4646033.1 hypothetical protein [Akkermansiaceae bacterium]MDP4721988.1 hypothetical protein [Akkermansiaceae bacterium]MDP4780809.1 hypothetical protein [Akkermansiaceae bacterium]MDP4847856.1 hypothetical protein [Akkermansiaceae bacterium]